MIIDALRGYIYKKKKKLFVPWMCRCADGGTM